MTKRPKPQFQIKSTAQVMIKGSVEKMQRPLDIIRQKPLPEVMNYLYFSDLGASKPIAKLIKSAAANALNLEPEINAASLYVAKIWAVKKMELRRMKAGPRGRGRPIRKRYSDVFVELGIKEG